MSRLTPRLLLAVGALLLLAWVVVPLSSSPAQGSAARVVVADPAPPPVPELEAIDREVSRLRERLDDTARVVAPVRDPFQFADAPVARDVAVRVARLPGDGPIADEPAAPAIRWPSLVAILSSGDEAAPLRRVVLGDAAGLVHVRAIGEAHGDITIAAITADDVTLLHEPSGSSTHLALD